MELRWSDQDANHHVNNATIVTLLEELRVRSGTLWEPGATHGDPRVVRTLEVRYDDELNYHSDDDGPVIVDGYAWISRIGRTSYQVSHELVQEGTTRVFSTSTIVVLDPATKRPEPIDDAFKRRLESLYSAPGE
ncbi:hypothetical protein CAQU_08110 [Corynebacterium aquilae DSM 44791]|uniref:Uncharacterized protein n=2 Tax=Corynebacterium aquilae TaxID=203263 RepID=A0A1L7CH17_9CORY|nr:hypothetical protein CAQU_08110 [Corynebacterium aquilae DSM 44791]